LVLEAFCFRRIMAFLPICFVVSCDNTTQVGRASTVVGNTLEGLATKGMQKIGLSPDTKTRSSMRGLLTDGIASALTPAEQQKAADTTARVLGKKVGTKSTWTSDTRPDVKGSSEVTSTIQVGDGSVCNVVKDIVIVNGEETAAEKKLCKPPGSSGFTIVT
jgi:surface antigen